jgi:hypothetical protein
LAMFPSIMARPRHWRSFTTNEWQSAERIQTSAA